ncbi:Telomerase reverse transcriptase [Cystobasidiomycetes sp. EMM_F5]
MSINAKESHPVGGAKAGTYEDAEDPLTQCSNTSNAWSALASQLSKASGTTNLRSSAGSKRKLTDKPRFSEFTLSQHQVVQFCKACIIGIFPAALWGSEKNVRCVVNGITRYVTARRRETLSVNQLLHGFSLTDVTWLQSPNNNSRPNQTDMRKRRELMATFLRWLFDEYLCILLRNNFYVTESSAFQQQTLYFLQEDWRTICEPLLDQMTSTLFTRISAQEAKNTLACGRRHLSFARVRLLPKERGVRPIVNLSRKEALHVDQVASRNVNQKYVQQPRSINQALNDAFRILNAEKAHRPDLVGSALFMRDVYARVKAYKLYMGLIQGKKLYMVKMDIRACFDSIDQRKLLTIVDEILTDDYSLYSHASVFPQSGKVGYAFKREARPLGDFMDYPEFASDLAKTLHSTLFVDQINGQFYKQTVGIPQGSILSTLLCNFFIGRLEATELAFIDNSKNLLLRVVDDFMLVTPDRQTASRFLDVMYRGYPEFNCFVAPEKTVVNFDAAFPDGNAVKRIQKGEGE